MNKMNNMSLEGITTPLATERDKPRFDDIEKQTIVKKNSTNERIWKSELTRFNPPKIPGTVGTSEPKEPTVGDVAREIVGYNPQEERLLQIYTNTTKQVDETLQKTEPDEGRRNGIKKFLGTLADNLLGYHEKIETIAR